MKAPSRKRWYGKGHSGNRFNMPDKEWLEHQYWEIGKSLNDIASEVGVTHTTIKYWMTKAGVRLRTRKETSPRHSQRMSGAGNPAWIDGNSRNFQYGKLKRLKPDMQCAWCKTDEQVQIHHIDHDRTNHGAENLMWLCGYCNRLEAQLHTLSERKRVSWHDHIDEDGVPTITIKFTSP